MGLFIIPIHWNAFKQIFKTFLTHTQINKYSLYAVLVQLDTVRESELIFHMDVVNIQCYYHSSLHLFLDEERMRG